MNWTFAYDEHHKIVCVKVEGKIVAARTAEMAVQGIKLARDKQYHKFLIDYTSADVADSTLDTYTFMTNLEDLGITPADQIAIVYSKDKVQHVFAETVAANRGWDNIRYCFDRAQAQEWLISLR